MNQGLRVIRANASAVECVALAARGVHEAAQGDAWVGLLWPGESDERGVLLAALRLAESQPEDVGALSVVRAEVAGGARRVRDVIRVVHPASLVELRQDADENLAVTGEVAYLGGDAIILDRAAAGGAAAVATAAENEGDWLKAAAAWALCADGPEPLGAWCELRRGLALAQLGWEAPQVRLSLSSALGRFPGLPEAAIGLASVAVARGRHGDASRFIRFADSLGEPPTVVPQPEGAGTWYVPDAASKLLAAVDPEAAERFQVEAMRRKLSSSLSPAVLAGGVSGN